MWLSIDKMIFKNGSVEPEITITSQTLPLYNNVSISTNYID